jgi:hypothetical protein
MEAKELAEMFSGKVASARIERDRQANVAQDNNEKYRDDFEHCKKAMTNNVLPFLADLKSHLPDGQFSFAPQIDAKDHAVVGVSFRIGDGAATTISTAFGNVIVTHAGASGSSKGLNFVYPPDAEPYISNSGDLTREKIGKLIAMMIAHA